MTRVNPKYSDILTHHRTCPKIEITSLLILLIYLKTAGWVANSVNLDYTWRLRGIIIKEGVFGDNYGITFSSSP